MEQIGKEKVLNRVKELHTLINPRAIQSRIQSNEPRAELAEKLMDILYDTDFVEYMSELVDMSGDKPFTLGSFIVGIELWAREYLSPELYSEAFKKVKKLDTFSFLGIC